MSTRTNHRSPNGVAAALLSAVLALALPVSASASLLWSGTGPLAHGCSPELSGVAVSDAGALFARTRPAGQAVCGGDPVRGLARWDGTRWQSVASTNPNDTAEALFNHAGAMHVVMGYASQYSVRRWNGSEWVHVAMTGPAPAPFEPSVHPAAARGISYNGAIYLVQEQAVCRVEGNYCVTLARSDQRIGDVAVYRGKLVIGGNFSTINDQPMSRLAMFDGSQWSAVPGAPTAGSITALDNFGDDLLVGGSFRFTAPGWTCVAQLVGGTQWQVSLQTSDCNVIDLESRGSEIYVSQSGPRLGMLVGSVLQPISSGVGDPYPQFLQFAEAGDAVLAYGNMRSYPNLPADGLIQLRAGEILPFGATGGQGIQGNLVASVVFRGRLVVAGEFRMAGSALVHNIAIQGDAGWQALGTEGAVGVQGINGRVRDVVVFDDQLVVVGYFQKAGGQACSNAAAWDGQSWTCLGSQGLLLWHYDYGIDRIAVHDGTLFVQSSNGGGGRWTGAEWVYLPTGSAGQDALESDGQTLFNAQETFGRIFRLEGTQWVESLPSPAPAWRARLLMRGPAVQAVQSSLAGEHRFFEWDGMQWRPLPGLGAALQGKSLGPMVWIGENLYLFVYDGTNVQFARYDGKGLQLWSAATLPGASTLLVHTLQAGRIALVGGVKSVNGEPSIGVAYVAEDAILADGFEQD